ncbi:MAG: peptidylprolyl isomerase [Chitinivibrionales bacterium]|nr:peptidylprolyl isomerase [Chitinivibrionales bacterium]
MNCMRHTFSIGLYLLFTLLAGAPTAADNQQLDEIVAIVGDSIILNSELEAFCSLKISQLGHEPDSLEKDIIRYRSLEELIDGKVLIVHAEKDTTISVTNQQIEAELNNRVSYILQQNRLSPEEFETILKKEQNLTLLQFKRRIRQQIRQELLKQKVQQNYIASMRMSRSDVEKFFSQYKDSLPRLGESILLSVISMQPSTSNELREEAFSKISAIKQLLNNGEDFAASAKKYSHDPNASNGGDLGFISKGDVSELLFEEKVFSLKTGQISDPFETRLGFHIVQAMERKDNKVHVRQIFISIKPSTEQIQSITSLLDSIKNNCTTRQDFLAAVQKFSADPISRSRNGQLHWQTVSSLDPAIKSSFSSVTIGALSTPIQQQKEISLYRIDSLVSNRSYTLADDWNEIEQIAQQVFSQKKLMEVVTSWRKKIYIEKKR